MNTELTDNSLIYGNLYKCNTLHMDHRIITYKAILFKSLFNCPNLNIYY